MKAIKSCKMERRSNLSTLLPEQSLKTNIPASLASDILLATGIPRIPNTSNPTDDRLSKTCPFGLSIATRIFLEDSAAYEKYFFIVIKN